MDDLFMSKYPDIPEVLVRCLNMDTYHPIASHKYVWAYKEKLDEFKSLMFMFDLKLLDGIWMARADNNTIYPVSGVHSSVHTDYIDIGIGARVRPDLLNNYIKRWRRNNER